MSRRHLEVGDCFVIPLPNGKLAYGQYVLWDDRPEGMGCLVRVFDLITDDLVSIEQLRGVGEMFPPVSVGLKASIRRGRWRIIGWLPVENFTYPQFRYTYHTGPGVYNDWRIWDGVKWSFVGHLTEGQRRLELKMTWGDELLEERILTRVNPFEGRR